VDRAGLLDWIAGYERAWRASGTEALAEVFDPDAVYLSSPYEQPVRGLGPIAEFWEAERSADEVFELDVDVVAVEGDTGVARLEVHYSAPLERAYRDLWIVTLDGTGLCTRFEEWPFWPEHGRVAPA
jgi:ketosteroid isomerase-like protein